MPKKPVSRCALCGVTWGKDDPRGLAHLLVAHGPLVGASPRKRKRVRAALPAIHRRLEEAGFDEVQAHQVVRIMAEELRKAGLV